VKLRCEVAESTGKVIVGTSIRRQRKHLCQDLEVEVLCLLFWEEGAAIEGSAPHISWTFH